MKYTWLLSLKRVQVMSALALNGIWENIAGTGYLDVDGNDISLLYGQDAAFGMSAFSEKIIAKSKGK